MTLKECLQAAVDAGMPVAFLAKRIGRDSSTLYKWLNSTRDPSEQVQQEVREELLRLKEEWNKIEIED